MLINDFYKQLEKEKDNFFKAIKLVKYGDNTDQLKKLRRSFIHINNLYRKIIKELEKKISEKKKDEKQLKDSFEELLYIQKLSKTIRFSKRISVILKTLTDITKQVLPVIESDIFMFDEKTNDYKSLVFKDRHSPLYNVVKNYIEEGIVNWVIEEKRSVVVSDIETIYNEAESGTERNYVFVPLFVLSEGVGIYVIYTSKPKNEFTKQDLDILDIITEQAAIAIENFRINKKLRDSEKILKKYKNRFSIFSKDNASV